VYLSPSLKRKSDAKKAEYYKNMQQEQEEEAKPGIFSRFMKPDQETKEESMPAAASTETETLLTAEKEKEKRAADAVKKAEGAKPGASISLFGMEFGIPSFQEERTSAMSKTSSASAPAPAPAPAPAGAPDKNKEQRAADAVKKVEGAKPGATINLFGLEFGVPSMGQNPTEKTATSGGPQGEKSRASVASKQAAAKSKPQALEEEKIFVEETKAPIRIDIGSCVLPHPSKVMWGGEDAVFTKGSTFGVFDGVSGADKLDGMPLYSKLLARQMTELVGPGNSLSIKDLQAQLSVAAEKCDDRATGASTAIVSTITEDGYLRAINLGDSLCIVIRGDKVVAKTKEVRYRSFHFLFVGPIEGS
jgi:hypothetical protein